MAKIYSCQEILTDETGARGSSSHSRMIGQLSEALIFSGACFTADVLQRHADWLCAGCCLGLPGCCEEPLRGNSFISPEETLNRLSQIGTEIVLSASEGDCRKRSVHISSWYEGCIPQIAVFTRAVSEICFWHVKTNYTLKEPQIQKSVFGFLMTAASPASTQTWDIYSVGLMFLCRR